MDLPRPPEDPEMKNIIDKLANFVARNGPEFEQMTKQKQKDNPKFSFLFAGEHFNYYQYRVTTEQAIIKQQQQKMQQQQAIIQQVITQQSIRTAPWQQPTNAPVPSAMQEQLEQQRQAAADQIKQSETNLAAQYQSIMQQQQVMIDEAIHVARKEQLTALSNECEISLDELNSIVQPIIESCTKDAISNGKNWIFQHNTSQRHGDLMAHYLLDRVSSKDACFELRLHLIYLVNDILHHCKRRNADDLRKSLESVVVPLFCISQLGVDEERQNKLSKLLSLWETNGYFDPMTIQSMKNPFQAMATYQAGLLATHSGIVTQISQEMNARYLSLQKQHQEFAAHLNNQIGALEQQMMMQASSNAGPGPGMMGPSSSGPMPGGPPPMPSQSGPMHPGPPGPPGMMGGNMPPMGQPMPGNSGGFGPRGPPGFGPPGAPPGYHQPPPPGFGPHPPPQQFDYGHGQGPVVMSEFGGGGGGGMPPMPAGPPGNIPLPDLSKPPPGFPPGPGFGGGPGPGGPGAGPGPGLGGASHPPPLMSLPLKPPPEADLMPSMPYFDLPAGLMAPLVKLEDCDYKPLDPRDIRLPPPMPPTDRLLAAVEAFYSAPSHERPRDSEGWEKLGLFEFFKAKQKAKRMKEDMVRRRSRSRSNSPRRHRSAKRRSPSRSRSQSESRTRSRSRSKSASRSRSRSRSHSREKTPPGFYSEPYYQATSDTRLGEENKGHQLLTKMGWGGGGLGQTEQGIMDPIPHAEVRDRSDMFKGVGISLNDPFENFRKNKSHGFVTRMREKAEAAIAVMPVVESEIPPE